MSRIGKFAHTQLTDLGNGSIAKLGPIGNRGGVGKIIIANINTSVEVRYDYSDAADFSSQVYQGQPISITANGSYVIPLLPGFGFARPVFVNEVGGTDATVDFETEIHD